MLGSSPTAEFQHREGVELLSGGRVREALHFLGEALAREETWERWNDWAAAAFLAGDENEAEHGFRRALELAPGDQQVAENLGTMLAQQGRLGEALPLLKAAVRAFEGESQNGGPRQQTAAMLEDCRRKMLGWFREFEQAMTAKPEPVEQIPRWPLARYALRLAQLGEVEDALEMVRFNRHFQTREATLVKLQACLEAIQEPGKLKLGATRGSVRA